MSEFIEYKWGAATIGAALKSTPKFSEQRDRTAAIQSLKRMIEDFDDKDLSPVLPRDDKTLQKFLFARKFDLTDTFELMKNYYAYKKRNYDIFENLTLDANDIRKSLENALPGVLSHKDRKGRSVLIFTGTNWDCTYGLVSIYRALLFVLEHLIEHIHNQSNGFVVIVDWTEFTFKQTTNLKPSVLKLMIEGLQDCFPARFKGIHFISQPWYVEVALAAIKPFLNERVKDRIYVHGNNLSTLHEHVHKDVLPAELGGEQPSYNPGSFLDTLQKYKI